MMVAPKILRPGRDDRPDVLAVERTVSLRRAAAMVLQLVEGRTSSSLIGIAAPSGGEGTSLVAETLAGTLSAYHGGRVVLADGSSEDVTRRASPVSPEADLEVAAQLWRRPHEGFDRQQGFDAAAYPDRRGAEAFTDALRAACDVAVVVLPPLLKHPEALSLAAQLDGVVLVLEAERTRWEVAREAKQLMDGIGVKLLGVILNKRKRHIPDFLYRLL